MRNYLYTTALFLLSAAGLAAQPLEIRHVSSPLLVRETRGFTEGPDGTIYFFTGDDNLYRIQDDTLVVAMEYECPSFCGVQDIYAGPDSALYVGTKFGGLHQPGLRLYQRPGVQHCRNQNSIGYKFIPFKHRVNMGHVFKICTP